MSQPTDVRDIVREKYGEAARRVKGGEGGCCAPAPDASGCCSPAPAASSCCGAGTASMGSCDPITSNLYDASQSGDVPGTALAASLGCGNPTALAELEPGETVLDLGSGGGDMLRAIWRAAAAKGLSVQLTGIDHDQRAAEAARAATPG